MNFFCCKFVQILPIMITNSCTIYFFSIKYFIKHRGQVIPNVPFTRKEMPVSDPPTPEPSHPEPLSDEFKRYLVRYIHAYEPQFEIAQMFDVSIFLKLCFFFIIWLCFVPSLDGNVEQSLRYSLGYFLPFQTQIS